VDHAILALKLAKGDTEQHNRVLIIFRTDEIRLRQ